jgi:hypothetical protein
LIIQDLDEILMAGTSCAVPVHLSILPPSSALRRPSSDGQLTSSSQTVADIISLLDDFLLATLK